MPGAGFRGGVEGRRVRLWPTMRLLLVVMDPGVLRSPVREKMDWRVFSRGV